MDKGLRAASVTTTATESEFNVISEPQSRQVSCDEDVINQLAETDSRQGSADLSSDNNEKAFRPIGLSSSEEDICNVSDSDHCAPRRRQVSVAADVNYANYAFSPETSWEPENINWDVTTPRQSKAPRPLPFQAVVPHIPLCSLGITEHFQVKTTLNDGSMSTVVQAVSKKTDQKVAIKIVNWDEAHEVHLAALLDHPHIVKAESVYFDELDYHLVMELGRGDLSLLIAANKIPGKNSRYNCPKSVEVLACLKQLMSAVTYLHSHGIAHRNITPENCLLFQLSGGRQRVKLTDFGVACRYQPGEMLTGEVCAPSFAAPETFEGRYDNRCDIWSAGAVCHKLAIGRHVFEIMETALKYDADKCLKALKAKSLNEDVMFDGKSWRFHDSSLVEVFSRILIKDPKMRSTRDVDWRAAYVACQASATPTTSGKSFDRKEEAAEPPHCCAMWW